MAIVVDQHGLWTAANQLLASTHTYSVAVAEPPGLDATSVTAVAQINASAAVLVALLTHGSALREVGALAVTATADTLTGQDDANATGIATLATPQTVSTPSPLPSIPEPVLPAVPALPAVLAPLPGEAHAQALYNGPGSQSLHALAQHLHTTASGLRGLSEDLHRTGALIDTSWDDGHQQAGANTQRHARWLADMSEHTATLAARCRTLAQGFETAKNSTPSPQKFAQARTNLATAIARFNASGGLNAVEVQSATHHLATLNSQATSSALTYHAHTTAAPLGTDTPAPAPPITRNGTVQAVDRHTIKEAPPDDSGGSDDDRPWRDRPSPRTAKEVQDALDQLRSGRNQRVREFDTPEEIRDFYDWLTGNSAGHAPSNAPFPREQLDDGTIISLRPDSRSGGETIGVIPPAGNETKVHLPITPSIINGLPQLPPLADHPPFAPPLPGPVGPTPAVLPPWLQNPALQGTPIPSQGPTIMPGVPLPASPPPVTSTPSPGPSLWPQIGHDLAHAGEKMAVGALIGVAVIGGLLSIGSSTPQATP